MNEISNKELKNIEYDLLKKVHDFCAKNNLKYYLWGGTLLGSVRHNGFIPWDDDIDIAMPRADYEAFIHSFEFDDCSVMHCETNKGYHAPYAKAYDKSTIKIESISVANEYSIGVDVDIFPIDSYQDINAVTKTLKKRKLLLALRRISLLNYRTVTSLKNICINMLVWFVRKVCRITPNKISRKINQLAMSFSGENAENCMLYADSNLKTPILIDSSWQNELLLYKFEDREFYIPTGYDKILTVCYGDYMTPPPEDKRVTHHGFKAYWK